MKPIYMPGVNHVMVDIETLDVTPDSHIMSIAAVPFALSAQEEIDMFFNLSQFDVPLEYHEHIELPVKIENNDTFRFHVEKKTGAIENCLKNGQPLKDVLGRFHRVMTQWAPEGQDYFIWGWGYGFDMTILAHAYRTHPDSWWKDKTWNWPNGIVDYRTKNLFKEKNEDVVTLGGTIALDTGSKAGDVLVMNADSQAVWTSANVKFHVEGKTWELPYWLKRYTCILDGRSIFFGHGKTYGDMPVRKGQHHDALDDVKHQILTIQRTFTGEDSEE